MSTVSFISPCIVFKQHIYVCVVTLDIISVYMYYCILCTDVVSDLYQYVNPANKVHSPIVSKDFHDLVMRNMLV